MQCTDVLERIDLYLSGDLGYIAGIRLKHHLFACRSCYAEMRRARQVHGVLGDYLTHLRPPTALSDRVLRAVAEVPAPAVVSVPAARPSRRWAKVAKPMAFAAAAALVALVLWLVHLNQSTNQEILARVASIQGSARYYEPGSSEGVPLTVNLFVLPDGRVETSEDSTATLEGDNRSVRYEIGPRGAIGLRRGPQGAVVEYERGSLGVESQSAAAIEEVVTPVGSILPRSDRVAFEITSTIGFPDHDQAVKVSVREGTIEARTAQGSFIAQVPEIVLMAPGRAPEPWVEPRPLPPAAPPPRLPAPSIPASPKPAKTAPPASEPESVSPQVAVQDVIGASTALGEYARRHASDAAGPPPAELVELVHRYQQARTQLIALGVPALDEIFRAYQKLRLAKSAAAFDFAKGPLAECAELIAAATVHQSFEAAAKFDRTMQVALLNPGTLEDPVWDHRPSLFIGESKSHLLLSALESESSSDEDAERAAARLEEVIPLRSDFRFSAVYWSRRLANAFRAQSPSASARRVAILRVLYLLDRPGAGDSLTRLEAEERDENLLRRIRTYRTIGPIVVNSAPPGSVIAGCNSSPQEILRLGLDGETVLEVLLFYTAWTGGPHLSQEWRDELLKTYEGTPSLLAGAPTESMQRLAAIALGRGASSTLSASRALGHEVSGSGVEDPDCSAVLAVGAITRRPPSPWPGPADIQRFPRLCLGLHVLTGEDFLPSLQPSSSGVRAPEFRPADIALAVLEAAATSHEARRRGIWHSLK